MASQYLMLKNRAILDILDGTTDFGKLEINGVSSDITVSMPYLSGSAICDISYKYGLAALYGWNGGGKSRWQYLEDLLNHCISSNNVSSLLTFLFSKQQFQAKLQDLEPKDIEYAYQTIVSSIIKKMALS